MDFVLRSGDQAIFDTTFGAAIVVAPPGILTGTSKAKVDGAIVCIVGDEASVVVVATYTTIALPTAGAGMLRITGLVPDQRAVDVHSTRVALVLRGSRFLAQLQVTKPAQSPEGTPDPLAMYSGGGTFVTANAKVRAI
ncbi:MAG: hypothetical protein H7138_18920 [Myxococcales bacterium]|nr:hypothetical protein [Myxococcales bacterium]